MKILKNKLHCFLAFLLFNVFAFQSMIAQQTEYTPPRISEIAMKISRSNLPKDNTKLYEEMAKKFEMDSTNRFFFMGAAAGVAASWLREENIEEYQHYANIVFENAKTGRDNYLLTVFIDEIIKGWAIIDKNLPLCEKLAKARLAKVDKPQNDNVGLDDDTYFVNVNYARRAFTYAFVLYHLGELEQALQYTKKAKAVGVFNKEDVNNIDFANFYAAILSANGHHNKAIEKLSAIIKLGQYNANTLTRLKDVYIQIHGGDKGYDDFQTTLEQAAYKEVFAQIGKKKIKKANPAPAVVFENLEGETVALDKYKGKIVVLDFWAIWCAPCIRSFPGMQTVMREFENDSEVVFLYINTKETAHEKTENITQKVKNFMADRGYSFTVLLDKDDSAYKKFKITGLPTKLVLDKNGIIRFKLAGFPGSDGLIVNEVKAMIEYVKNNSKL